MTSYFLRALSTFGVSLLKLVVSIRAGSGEEGVSTVTVVESRPALVSDALLHEAMTATRMNKKNNFI